MQIVRSNANQSSAFISGMALSLGMPAVKAIGIALDAPRGVQEVIFLLGLVVFFLGPVLVFVVGTGHLGIRSGEAHKAAYWSSLRQVGRRSLFWLIGCAAGFGLLAAVKGVLF